MFYLNNQLLTNSGIITFIQQAYASNPDLERIRRGLKKTLKKIYFSKSQTEGEMLVALTHCPFSEYPRLKELLMIIFWGDIASLVTSPTDDIEDWIARDWEKKIHYYQKIYGNYISHSSPYYLLYPKLVAALRLNVLLKEKFLHNDAVIYEGAYKLLALAIDVREILPQQAFYAAAKNIQPLLKSAVNFSMTLNELLMDRLLLPTRTQIKFFPFWQDLIRKRGVAVLPQFSIAPRIEFFLQKNTWDCSEESVKRADLYLSYPDAMQDEEFAMICKKQMLPHDIFSYLVNYMKLIWPRKLADRVPNVVIDTASFRWEKLPSHDKRALILGKLTSCCQSMEDFADSCVKEAISFPENAIYVLYKKEKKQISIIGQSYVWLSVAGNLCLDSFEYLNRRITKIEIKSILEQFAAALFREYPQIKRVTIGVGGNTPMDIFPKTEIPELIRYGSVFPDSSEQYCIASRNTLSPEQASNLKLILASCEIEFRAAIEYLVLYAADIPRFMEELSQILARYPTIKKKLTLRQLMLLFAQPNAKPQISDLYPLPEKLDAQALASISIGQFIFNASLTDFIASWINFPLGRRFDLALASVMYFSNGSTILHENAYSYEFLKVYLTEMDAEERWKLITYPDCIGNTLLHLSADCPDSLALVLGFLNSCQAKETFKHYNFCNQNLLFFIHHPKSLNLLMQVYEGKYLDLFLQVDNRQRFFLQRIIKNSQLFAAALSYIGEEDLFQLCFQAESAGKTLFLIAMDHPESFYFLLNSLPKERLADVLMKEYGQGRYVLHEMVKFPKLLLKFLSFYSFDDFYHMACLLDNSGRTAFQIAASQHISLNILLDQFSESQQKSLVALFNRNISTNLFHHAFRDIKSFHRLLALYPLEERQLLLMQKINFYEYFIQALFERYDFFQQFMEMLSDEDQQTMVTYITAHDLNIIQLAEKNLEVLIEIVGLHPEEQRFDVLCCPSKLSTKPKTVMEVYLQDKRFLSALWRLLPDSGRSRLLQGFAGQSLLEMVLMNSETLPIAVDFYHPDALFRQIFHILQVHRNWFMSLLHHSQQLYFLLQALSDDERWQILMMKSHDNQAFISLVAQKKDYLEQLILDFPNLWLMMYANPRFQGLALRILTSPPVIHLLTHYLKREIILDALNQMKFFDLGRERIQNSLIILIESIDSKELIPLLNALRPLVKHLLLSNSQFNWSLLNSIIEVTANPDLITLLNLELSPGIKIWRYLFDDIHLLNILMRRMPFKDVLKLLDYEFMMGINTLFLMMNHIEMFLDFLAAFSFEERIQIMQKAYPHLHLPETERVHVLDLIYQLERYKFEIEKSFVDLPIENIKAQTAYLLAIYFLNGLKLGEGLKELLMSSPLVRQKLEQSGHNLRHQQLFFKPLNRILEQGFLYLHTQDKNCC